MIEVLWEKLRGIYKNIPEKYPGSTWCFNADVNFKANSPWECFLSFIAANEEYTLARVDKAGYKEERDLWYSLCEQKIQERIEKCK